MRIKDFAALRPATELAAEVASPPYDVIDSAEARALAGANTKSFLHIIKPEIDLPEGTDLYSDAVYDMARSNFERFQAEGWLVRDAEPNLYVYQQQAGDHKQIGVVCTCHIDDYTNGIIKKHEFTLKKKEDDRTRHVKTLMANAGPVFLTYRDDAAIDVLIAEICAADPVVDLTDEQGVRHTAWRAPDAAVLKAAFGEVAEAYVADGHHRSASAVRVGAESAAGNPDHDGSEAYNWFLCVLFPADQLQVLAYNRLVADLNGQTPEAFLAALGETFERVPGTPAPERQGVISMYFQGAWHALTPKQIPDDPVGKLDVSICQHQILTPLLGIDDPKTNPRISFKGGQGSTDILKARVDSGEVAVAFSLFPTGIRDMMDVADIGEVMPPKSTWFEPKLRSGLFVNLLD